MNASLLPNQCGEHPDQQIDTIEQLGRLSRRLPRREADELLGCLNRILDATSTQRLQSAVRLKGVCHMAKRASQQRDAYHRFVTELLKAGIERDPQFFRPHRETFQRLCDEFDVPETSEEEIRIETVRQIEERLAQQVT